MTDITVAPVSVQLEHGAKTNFSCLIRHGYQEYQTKNCQNMSQSWEVDGPIFKLKCIPDNIIEVEIWSQNSLIGKGVLMPSNITKGNP